MKFSASAKACELLKLMDVVSRPLLFTLSTEAKEAVDFIVDMVVVEQVAKASRIGARNFVIFLARPSAPNTCKLCIISQNRCPF